MDRGGGHGGDGDQRGALGSGRGSGRDGGLRESSGARLNSRGRARGGGEEVAHGGRRVRAPARGAVSADAAKAHVKRWEGDEEGADAAQRLTEMSKARGQEEEEDTGEEGDGA